MTPLTKLSSPHRSMALIFLLALALSACAPAANLPAPTAAIQTVEVTQVVTQVVTAEVTQVVEVQVTNTPTATLEPTATPDFSPTPTKVPTTTPRGSRRG